MFFPLLVSLGYYRQLPGSGLLESLVPRRVVYATIGVEYKKDVFPFLSPCAITAVNSRFSGFSHMVPCVLWYRSVGLTRHLTWLRSRGRWGPCPKVGRSALNMPCYLDTEGSTRCEDKVSCRLNLRNTDNFIVLFWPIFILNPPEIYNMQTQIFDDKTPSWVCQNFVDLPRHCGLQVSYVIYRYVGASSPWFEVQILWYRKWTKRARPSNSPSNGGGEVLKSFVPAADRIYPEFVASIERGIDEPPGPSRWFKRAHIVGLVRSPRLGRRAPKAFNGWGQPSRFQPPRL